MQCVGFIQYLLYFDNIPVGTEPRQTHISPALLGFHTEIFNEAI